jgi:hypothetical protein
MVSTTIIRSKGRKSIRAGFEKCPRGLISMANHRTTLDANQLGWEIIDCLSPLVLSHCKTRHRQCMLCNFSWLKRSSVWLMFQGTLPKDFAAVVRVKLPAHLLSLVETEKECLGWFLRSCQKLSLLLLGSL